MRGASMTSAREALAPIGLAGLLLACVSCGGEPEERGICDLRSRACQRGIYRELVELRGGVEPPSLPRVRLITRAEIESLLRAEAGEEEGSAADPGCVAEAFSRGLQQLGLLAPATPIAQAAAETFTEGVAAFYSGVDDTVTIIDEPSEDPVVDLGTLAHELTHALQQRERLDRRLAAWPEQGSDADLARLALLEGEATFLGLALTVARSGGDVREANWEAAFDLLDALTRDEVAQADSPLVAARFALPYALGGRSFSRRFLQQARADLPAIYDAWPRSTIGLVAARGEDPPVERVPLACGRPGEPAGSIVADDDRLGVVGVYALAAKVLALVDPAPLVRAWRDDRMLLHVGPDQAVAVSWRLRLAQPADAELLFTRATSYAADHAWQVLRQAPEEVALLGAWPHTVAATCLPPDEPLQLFGPSESAAAERACEALRSDAPPALRNTSLQPPEPREAVGPRHRPLPLRAMLAAALD